MKRVLTDRVFHLSTLTLASLAIYARAFAWPYSIWEWWREPLLDISKISHENPRAIWTYVASLAILFVCYALTARVVTGRQRAAVWVVVIAGAIGFNFVMISLYPVGALDLFDNVIRGRMTACYGANPFYQTPVEFERDPFFPYAAWDYSTSAYGPLWETIAAVAAKVAGNSMIANVLVFKSVSIGAYAATAVLIARMLRRRAPERMLTGIVLFAWNPLVIYTVAGNGHNDAVMVFFLVLGFYLLDRGRFTLAAMAETAGVLVKFIPALIVPVVMVTAITRLRGWPTRIRYTAITAVVCGLMIIGFYAPFWRGGDVMGVGWRSKMFTSSLPTLLVAWLEPRLTTSVAEMYVSRVALGILVVWMIWQVIVLWRSKDMDAGIRAGASILMFYLLVSCLWFQPWYLIWPLALIVLLPNGPLQEGTVLLSYTATWKMPILFFIFTRAVFPLPTAWPDLPVAIGIMGIVWVYFIYQGLKLWLDPAKRRAGARTENPQ